MRKQVKPSNFKAVLKVGGTEKKLADVRSKKLVQLLKLVKRQGHDALLQVVKNEIGEFEAILTLGKAA